MMFKFFGMMNRSQFALAAGIRLTLFIASVLGFPYILWAFANVSGCRSVGGACGAMALIVSQALKPLFTLIFLISFIGICLRRTRDIGLPPWLGLAVPLLFALDYAFLTYPGAHWSLAFVHGVMKLRFPWFAIAALVLLAVLCLWPSRRRQPGEAERDGGGNGPFSSLVPSPWIIAGLFAAAVVLTIVASASVLGGASFLMVAQFAPTIALYFMVIWALYALVMHRSPAALVLLAVALAPFAHWGYRSTMIAREVRREAAEIAAIPTKRAAQLPSTIVVEARRDVPDVWSLATLERQLEKTSRGTYKQTLRPVQRTRAERRNAIVPPPELAELPSEYLLLKIGQSSSFFKPRHIYDGTGGPYELRLIGPGRDDLLAVDYHSNNKPLTTWPLLTEAGWMRKPNTYTSADSRKAVSTFLQKAIGAFGRSAAL